MSRKISLKAVAIVMGFLLLLAIGIHSLRGYQVRRNARALLVQADRARDEKDFVKELRYLQTYLSLVRYDKESQARFALLLCEHMKTQRERGRAYFALEEALRQNPERADLRHKAIEMALSLRRASDALFHLQVLHEEAGKKDADVMEAMGNVEFQRRAWAMANGWYEKSIRQDPKRISAYVARATVLRRHLNRPDEADKVIKSMIDANPDRPEVEIARIRYTRELKGDSGQNEQLRKTLAALIKRHAKAFPDLLMLAATIEQESGDLDRARKLLQQGVKLHPNKIAFPLGLARLELRDGKQEEALRYLRQIIDKLPPRGVDYWTTIELLLEAGDKKEAASLVNRIARNEDTASLVDYLEARLAFSDGRWLEAAQLLERTQIDRELPSEMVQAFHLLQGRCYQRLGNPDRYLELIRASLEQDPFWVPGLIAKAEALAGLGQEEEAISLYETMLGRWSGARSASAELWIRRNQRLAEDLRNWDRPLALLDGDSTAARASATGIRLRARVLLGRGNSADEVKTLEDGCKKHAKDIQLWLELAEATDRSGQEGKVAAVLQRAKEAAGDQIEFRFASAQLASRKSLEDANLLLASAERDAEGKPADERLRWLRALSNFYLGRGEVGPAERVLNVWSKSQPDDLEVWRGLFDIAILRREFGRLESIVQKIEKLEGPDGVLWRYGRAVLLAEQGKPENFARAKTWLNEARKRRPSWSQLYILEGRIAEAEGNAERAADQYKAALDRSAGSPEVIGRLVRILNAQRRYSEARTITTRYQAILPRTGELGRLATLTSWYGRDNLDQGLEMARKTLSATSKDYQDHLLAGQIFWAAGHRDEAEKSLLRARELNDKQPECYVTLVSFYAEKETKQADAMIKLAAEKLPPSEVPLVLGACYEILGQKSQAEAQYKAALALRVGDPAVLGAAAMFYLRSGQLGRAEPLFRKLMADKSSIARTRATWARRTLALAQAATGDYDRYRDALSLLDENVREGTASPDDQRARALVLARQPRERREAIRQLEAAFARIVPTPEEEFFLIALLVANRDWSQAQQRMVRLLTSREGANPIFLIYYLDQLIQNSELEKTDQWLRRLEELEPASLRTTGIKARLFQARKEPGRAKDLIRKYADAHLKDPAQQLGVARLLESLGFAEDAEQYFRNFTSAQQDKNPRAVFPLIEYLARRNRGADAMKLAESIQGKVPDVLLALTYINVLREGQPTAAESQAVKDWLSKAKKKDPNQAIYDLALANVSDLQGNSAEAIQLYRDLVSRNSRNILARNNLAVLLALQEKKTEQALECIDKAIDIDGPQPNLLDTQGIVYLAMQQPAKAIAALEEATQMAPDAASYFRLASAHLQNKDRRAAQSAFTKARAAGFSLNNLHPLERPAAKAVLAALGEGAKSIPKGK